MTLQQLEYILAVNQFRHFAKAAEYCRVTQPTLSAMIQKLEEELDTRIFDRSQQPVCPTPVGIHIIEQAQNILVQANRIKNIIEEEKHSLTGTFKLGILPTVAPYLLPRFFPQLMKKYPDLDIRVVEMKTNDIKKALQTGEIDAYTWFDFPKEVGERLVKECLENYAAAYGETVLYSSKRNEYLITRMERILDRTVQTLQYQLQQGAFTPENFEMSFEMASDLDAVNITLSEEEKMRLIGRIDRIDTCERQDKLYVKVIDYKSGNRRFDLAALYYGLQLQLVVYMNAAVEMQQKAHRDKKVIPAAMLYYHVSDPMTDTDKGQPDPQEIQDAILEELKMTGIVSDEEEIIQLLDKDFTDKSKVLPVAKKKDGSFTQASSVLSQEDFHVVSDYVNHKIRELGSEILSGDIALNPYKQTKGNACTYCSYRSICGFDRKLGADLVRELQDMNQEEALDEMKKELEEEPWQ